MAYWRLYYHLIWATYQRHPLLNLARERIVCATIIAKARELAVELHGMGSVSDHIHVVASIPPKLAVAECVQRFKGASSHAVNALEQSGAAEFKWQSGYGALSVSERSLRTVANYAIRQKAHHEAGTVVEYYERMNAEE